MNLSVIALLCALLAVDVSADHQRHLSQSTSSCANSCSNVLSSASVYGALGHSTVTNVGNTIVAGDVGVYPGSSVTGFPPGFATNIPTNADSQNEKAQSDAYIAYYVLLSLATSGTPLSKELAGAVVYPGVYFFSEDAHLAGELTFDANYLSNATFVFQISTDFRMEIGSKVTLVNGAQACNIYFQVGREVVFFATASFSGNIVAYTDIIVGHATSIVGSLISITTAVTLDDNFISTPIECEDSKPPPSP